MFIISHNENSNTVWCYHWTAPHTKLQDTNCCNALRLSLFKFCQKDYTSWREWGTEVFLMKTDLFMAFRKCWLCCDGSLLITSDWSEAILDLYRPCRPFGLCAVLRLLLFQIRTKDQVHLLSQSCNISRSNFFFFLVCVFFFSSCFHFVIFALCLQGCRCCIPSWYLTWETRSTWAQAEHSEKEKKGTLKVDSDNNASYVKYAKLKCD